MISIGMIREDGKKYYAITSNTEVLASARKIPWLRSNVIPSLPLVDIGEEDGWGFDNNHPDYINVKPRYKIADDVKKFILGTTNPELWAYYSAYDHIALCQLFGRMIDLPHGIPMYTNDLKSLMVSMGSPRVPEQSEGAHNALADATWNKETYEYLQGHRKDPERLLGEFQLGSVEPIITESYTPEGVYRW